jgi:alpha-L-fucosidase
MKRIFIVSFALFALSFVTVQAQSPFVQPAVADGSLSGYKLAWRDEFDGTAVNTSEWNYRTGERYWSTQRPENVSVVDGKLRLALKKEKFGNTDYTAGGLISKREFKFGYYEARLKMPRGKGWHTSFWMMRNGDDRDQELDVCEQDSINPNEYSTNVHGYKPKPKAQGAKRIATPDLTADFHVWGCEFTPTTVTYYFDGKIVDTRDVTNVPLGDVSIWLTSIAAPLGKTDKVDDSALPAFAEFDYVRFFESDEELMKRNAAEQATALNQNAGNQDPGGADRDKLIAERMREKITAGLAGERTAHRDAQWFGRAALGLFLHWGIAGVDGDIDLSWAMVANMGRGKKLKPVDYWKLADRFNAENYDPNKWLAAARAAGFDYAVLTTKHHDGFTLWPTETTDLGVRTHLGGRDLVKEYVAACRKNGLKVGFYFSGPDWYLDQKYRSFNYRSQSGKGSSSLPPIPGRTDYDVNHQPYEVPDAPPEFTRQLQQRLRRQLTELLTRYGKIDVLWFDGGSGSDLTLEEIRKLQPGIVINNRGNLTWQKTGGVFAGDYFSVEYAEALFRPPGWWEQLRIWNAPYWGYSKKNETAYGSTASILKLLVRTRAWGGALMVNAGPRPDGTMPEPFYQGMREVAEWMKIHRASVIGTDAVPEGVESNVPITTHGNVWYLHAVAGFKDAIVIKSGKQLRQIKSATLMRSGQAVKFEWDGMILRVPIAAVDPNLLHEVIQLRIEK